MVSSVTESLMQARIPMWALIFLLPPSLATEAQERRDQYGQSGH
ncbi:hypothetical protein [Aeromonas caviae]|nr:hypothetical protein [Aeromonas caviae]MDH0305988.1 hypothetical protein [Aeromonas caviae]MDX7683923.1 hypothetical protein [Aeromonas caviae]MDX7727536.1 hypothetical protein [Aeromonas caviae]